MRNTTTTHRTRRPYRSAAAERARVQALCGWLVILCSILASGCALGAMASVEGPIVIYAGLWAGAIIAAVGAVYGLCRGAAA